MNRATRTRGTSISVRPLRPPTSRQQARTDATRGKLLDAAESIFARDGFEAARLEDIAAQAGYTRGAFYANFQGKEDIFFALLERWVGTRIAEVNALIAHQETSAKLLRALREDYVRKIRDRRFSLLSLEFKLFALRHPEAHARLRGRQRRLRATSAELLRRITRVTGRALPVSCLAAAVGFGALSNALSLEHSVDPSMVTEQDTRDLLGVFFDAMLGTGSAK
jgi:AcrR family transcriptional regulator